MKSVLISINPKWCELITNGKKTMEVRKTRPKCDVPFKCYIYCTKGFKPNTKYGYKLWAGRGKVVGEFVCKNMTCIQASIDYQGEKHLYNTAFIDNRICLSDKELFNYIYDGKRNESWGWHISDLVIYDKPKELHEFYKCGILSYDEWLYGIYNGKGGATLSYESYKNVFKLNRPPQSWSYVEEV